MVFGVQATPNLKVLSNTTEFTMTLQAAGNVPVVTRFALIPANANELSLTNVPQSSDKVLSLFRFSDEAKVKVVAHQALLRDMKSKKTKDVGLGIGVNPDFCKTAKLDYDREKFSVYIARSGLAELMPLIDNLSLKDLLEKSPNKSIKDC